MRRRPAWAVASLAVITSIAENADAQGRSSDSARLHRNDEKTPGQVLTPPSPYSNALRIARMLRDDGLVARLLAMHGMGKSVSHADLVAVVEAHETAGSPQLAVDFLRSRVRSYPAEQSTRTLLARLLARMGQSRDAVIVWRQYVDRFGYDALSMDDVVRYARDLSRTGDVDGAFAILVGAKEKAPSGATAYWTDLATLAWERDDTEAALTAYEHVYRIDPQTVHAGIRLMTLLAGAKRRDEAVRVAMAEHARTGDASAVLFAAHLLANDGDWTTLWSVIREAERTPGTLHRRAEYFLLKGDAAKHLGDLGEASKAYAMALALAPDNPDARASALWNAIESGDQRKVRVYIDRFRARTQEEAALWLPMAHGLASIGRTREALIWFALQLRTTPRDARLKLDLSDALSILGRESLAGDLRRRAIAELPTELSSALRSPRRTDEERHLLESAALVLRSQSGVPRADPWVQALLASSDTYDVKGTPRRPALRASRTEDELALDWYLSTGRPEHARRILARSAPNTLRKHRLALALVDGDPTQMKTLLADASNLAPEDRAHALLELERGREAMAVMKEEISRSPNGADAPGTNDELARLAWMHHPNIRIGGVYEHITGLDVAGPRIAMSHDGLANRLTYAASASRMVDNGRLLLLEGPRDEAEAGALLRISSLSAVTDISAAIDYQVGTPVARAGVFDLRRMGRRFTITTELVAGSRIYDTSFLRVAAVRNSAAIGVRYDLPHWYASAEIDGREEQTRRYEHLAWDAVATAETGLKLVTREPHVSIGAQVQASERAYPTRLPGDVTRLVSPNVELVRALPPSFQLVGGVVHLSRGDFSERSRPDRTPFPRYDCEAAFGALMPDTDTALHVLCGASARAPGGYVTLLAFYNRGVAGVRNNENAELALSYTLPF